MSDDPVSRKAALRQPFAEPVCAKDDVGPHRERGLPGRTRDHPAWPTFRRWADDHLGDVMLPLY